MSASDSVIPFSKIDWTLVLSDGGSNSITVGLMQTDISWTAEGAKYVEARVRDMHSATPVIRKTGDGNVTGSLMALVATLRSSSSSAPSLYEVMTGTGAASSWATTAAGDRKTIRAALSGNASGAGGATQTVTFNYCIFANVKCDPAGGEGLMSISAEFTDHENAPTIT